MSCSGIPPPPPDTKDHQHHHHHSHHHHHHHRQHRHPYWPMSFRSSVGSKPSRLGPLDGGPAPSPTLLPAALRIDLPMKSVAGTSGVGTSGYYTDMAGTLGSSWISRLRRPSPQPPPALGSQPSRAAQSVATDGVSAGTEGSGVHGGARGSPALVAPSPPPPPVAAESVPYLASTYHVQRLCLSPLGDDGSPQPPPRQVAAVDRFKGFGPLRFSDVRVDEYPNGINKRIPPVTPLDRSTPPYPLPLLPLPSHPQQQPQSQVPLRTNPVPKPWNLGANDAEAATAGRLNLRPPTGFFPLFANIVRAAEEAQGGPNHKTTAPFSAEEAKSDHVTRKLLASSAERAQQFSERHTVTPQNSARPNPTRVLHSNSSTGGSTVRLPSDGSTSHPDFLGRQRSSNEWLLGMNTAGFSSRSVSDEVSPAAADGERRSRRIPPFGSSRGPTGGGDASASASAKGCVLAAAAADPWRQHSSALPGIAEDGSHKAQMLYKNTIPDQIT